MRKRRDAMWGKTGTTGRGRRKNRNRQKKQIERWNLRSEERRRSNMIAIGSDHGGYDLKQRVIQYLEEKGIQCQDMGCHSKASCDYPVFGHAVAKAVAEGKCDKGIVICTTGIGISISANKVAGIRCALCSDTLSARMTRLHNDANVLAMGAGIVGENLALDIVETFLETEFSGEERHRRRVELIEKTEVVEDGI